jgi:hypothetical protein
MRALAESQAWSDATLVELLADAISRHAEIAATVLADLAEVAEMENAADGPDNEEEAPTGRGRDDFEREFGITKPEPDHDLLSAEDTRAFPRSGSGPW